MTKIKMFQSAKKSPLANTYATDCQWEHEGIYVCFNRLKSRL